VNHIDAPHTRDGKHEVRPARTLTSRPTRGLASQTNRFRYDQDKYVSRQGTGSEKGAPSAKSRDARAGMDLGEFVDNLNGKLGDLGCVNAATCAGVAFVDFAVCPIAQRCRSGASDGRQCGFPSCGVTCRVAATCAGWPCEFLATRHHWRPPASHSPPCADRRCQSPPRQWMIPPSRRS